MSDYLIIAGIILAGVVLFMAMAFIKRKTSRIDRNYFTKRWSDLQNLLQSNEGMKLAVIEADKLLDEALKQLRFKGTTMGERMVSAQKSFKKADSVWLAHKLRNKIVHETDFEPSRRQIQSALLSVRQALRDLGAL